ncbi:hypothetical protein B0H13DRAFT_1877862 [Mycena leptocephala]|nr:hypothetical protein B0H13DRAFT_1877862 [Mycena leptocephala]
MEGYTAVTSSARKPLTRLPRDTRTDCHGTLTPSVKMAEIQFGPHPAPMSSLTIFLKPRPTHEQYGTEWLPRGPSYGPFHPDYSPPSDATEEREFALPTKVVDQWTEFHREILPLLVVPQIDDSADPRELYAVWCRLSVVGRVSHVVLCLMFRVKKLQHDLGIGYSQDPIHVLCDKLMAGGIFSLEAPAIELKISVNMMSTMYTYLDSAYNYNVELKRRCSTWDRLCINSSFVFASLQRSLFGIPDKGPLPATTISPSSSSEGSDLGIHTFSASKEILTHIHQADRIPEDPPHYRSGPVRRHPHTRASN